MNHKQKLEALIKRWDAKPLRAASMHRDCKDFIANLKLFHNLKNFVPTQKEMVLANLIWDWTR